MTDCRLLRGDCLELMKEIPDGSVDFILSDIPYGTTRNRWDTPLDLKRMWEQYDRALKEDGACALFAQPPFSAVLGMSNIKNFRYEWIWEKPRASGFLNAHVAPLKAHEQVLIFYRRRGLYNPQKRYGFSNYRASHGELSSIYNTDWSRPGETVVTDGARFPVDVVRYKSERGTGHPTQKPVTLCEMLIRSYTDEGMTVLDSCMGSGTTGVAAVKTGRNFIGIELEQEYFDTACRRIQTVKEQMDGCPGSGEAGEAT